MLARALRAERPRPRESKTPLLLELEQVLEAPARDAGESTALAHRRGAEPAARTARGDPAAGQHRDRRPTKLLPVILVGQPELARRLNEPSLRQLKQRVALRCELKPLTLQGDRRRTSPAASAPPAARRRKVFTPRGGDRSFTSVRAASRARSA